MHKFRIIHAVLAALVMCGLAACRDGSSSIANGYEITYTSSDGVFIKDSGGMIVVDARVDGYKVVGEKILIARRPMETYVEEGSQSTGYRMLPSCEHLVLDLTTRKVEQTEDTGGLLCK
jgi:hypothetical protein